MRRAPTMTLLTLLIILLLLTSTQQQQLSPSDLRALADIRRGLRGLPGSTFFSTWDDPSPSPSPCSSFSGVACSPDPSDPSTLRISSLTLGTGLESSPGLSGPFPPSISSLSALTVLVVHPGRISGPLPPDLGLSCPLLRLLSVSHNLLSGPLPPSLSSLPGLHTLHLPHNLLSGPLLSLPNLKVLVLSSNQLTGVLPPELRSSSLIHLDLRQNSLTGELPPLPPTLRYLSLAANSFTGLINAAFSPDMFNLTYLDLSMNSLSGKIPTSVFSLPSLSSVLLHRNCFSGPLILPDPAPESWEVVDLSHNAISGVVPAGLAGAGSLFLNSNRLSGAVPWEVARRVYDGGMSTFYAQHNFLTSFPAPAAGVLPESVAVCLAYNCMDAPAAAEGGCPASSGGRQARPREQCPSDGR